MNEIQLSEGFAQRLIEAQFNSLEVKGWVRSFMTWLIDSKYRTYKRLDSFLKEQLENPSKELRNCVKDIKGQDSPNHDELIINILNFVVEKITYQTDEKRYGTEEYWGTSGETLKGYADCEGFNSLVYLLARACGVPSYLIWCCIGEINVPTSGDYIGYNTGHFWCLYYSLEKGSCMP